MNIDRERLRQAAFRALIESPDVPTGVRLDLLGEALIIRERCDAFDVVEVVLDAVSSTLIAAELLDSLAEDSND